MFDQLRVDQNSAGKLLPNHEKDSSKNFSAKSGSDFFSMIMEQVNYDARKGNVEIDYRQAESVQDFTRDNHSAKPSDDEIRSENTYNENILSAKDTEIKNSEIKDREIKDTETLQHKHIDANEKSHEDIEHKDIESEKSLSMKKVNDKNNKSSEEEENKIISQLHGESSVKKLMEIAKAVLTGDKNGEDSGFKKLFGNLKFNNHEPNKAATQSHIKISAEGDLKNSNEIIGKITKEIGESIRRELTKALESKKSDKQHGLSDRELKDVVVNAIEGIKKNRANDVVRHEPKISADDMKNDKKNVSPAEQNVFRKIESSDSSHFEKFSSGEKNPDRENFNYSSSKTDFSAKAGLDKIENAMKLPDFKENLQEIIDKAKITVRDNRNGAFTVRLNPQELGNVNVNLILENGVITGKFLVDNEDVKNILLNNLQELKYQLEEAGIEVGEFSVGVDSRHERELSSNIDETFVFPGSDSGEMVAASEIYNSAAEAHTGHINLII